MTGRTFPSWTRKPKPRKPRPTSPAAAATRALLRNSYESLRTHCADLEELIEHATLTGALSAKELKRLDKGVTLMKAGFKYLKKVARDPAEVALPPEMGDDRG